MTMQAAPRTPIPLADVTNGADGTYYYYLDMRQHKLGTIQCTLNGGSGSVTVTVEASVEEGADNTALNYQDVTLAFFGVASVTSSSMFFIRDPSAISWLRVKVVAATGAADDADWKVDAKLMN